MWLTVALRSAPCSHSVPGVLEAAAGPAGVRVGPGGLWGGAAAAPAKTRVRDQVHQPPPQPHHAGACVPMVTMTRTVLRAEPLVTYSSALVVEGLEFWWGESRSNSSVLICSQFLPVAWICFAKLQKLIVSKLNTQAIKTQHCDITFTSGISAIEKLCYRNLTILCQNLTLMTKWYTLASYKYTFISAATH